MIDSSTAPTHVPVRMCIGCRRRAPKGALLRVVVAEGVPVVDERKRMQGRGAYLCRRERCFVRADKRGALPRAFRRTPLRAGISLVEMWRDMTAAPGAEQG